jgi:hypothetical protein
MKIYLAEIQYLNPLTIQTGMLYLGSKGFCSQPGDTPANQAYPGVLKISGNYDAHVFRDGLTAGVGDGGFGKIRVINNNGAYDWLRNMSFDGFSITILRGDNRAPRSTFRTVFTGVMCSPAVTWKYVDFQIRDYTQLLAAPISWNTFLGNNVPFSTGIEGTPDDLINKSKPLGLGYVRGATPALVNSSLNIWMLHGYGAIQGVVSAKIGGVVQTLDTSQGTGGDCYTLATLYAATPASGKYCTCLDQGLIMFGSGTGNAVVTVDFHGDADPAYGGYADSVPAILQRIVQKYVQVPRVNVLPAGSDLFANWSTSGGMTLAGPAANAPYPGMTAEQLTGGNGATLSLNVAYPTNLANASLFVKGTGSVTLQVADANAPANCFFVTFNLATGAVTNLQTQGQALGPQYTVSGFVTDGNIQIAGQNGWWRIWTCGQPNQSFTNVLISLVKNDSLPLSVSGPMLCNRRTPPVYTAPGTTGYDPLQGITIDPTSFAALAAAVTAEGGYYVPYGNSPAISEVMNALCVGPSIWFIFNRLGNMMVGQLAKPNPNAIPKRIFGLGTQYPFIQDSFDWTPFFQQGDPAQAYAYRIEVQGDHNNTPMNKSDVATSLWTSNPLLVAWLTNEWRQIVAEDDSVRGGHNLACVLAFTSYLASLADCQANAARMLAFYSNPPGRWTGTTKDENADDINVGDTVAFVQYRFGFGMAVTNALVLGISDNRDQGETALELAA